MAHSCAALRDDIIAETYEDLKLLVFKVAHRFSFQYSLPFDELLTEAHRSFVRSCDSHRPAKGARMSSWVYRQLWGDLMDFTRRELRRKNTIEVVEDPDFGQCCREDTAFLPDLREELSEDANLIVTIILESPSDFSLLCKRHDAYSRKPYVHALKEHLTHSGWTADQIAIAFDEIRWVLRK